MSNRIGDTRHSPSSFEAPDDVITPEQRLKCAASQTPEQRVRHCAQQKVNEVANQHFRASGEDAPKSPLGQKISNTIERATSELPVGGKVELHGRVTLGHGLHGHAGVKVEIAREEHGWEVLRSIGAGVGAGAHADESAEAGAGFAVDFAEHYEYRSREAAGSAGAALTQEALPDDLVDPDLDVRLGRMPYARTATSFSVSTELMAKAGAAAGPFGAEVEAKTGTTVRVKVNEHTGEVALGFGPDASARIAGRAGVSAGLLDAAVGRDLDSISASMKAELNYKLTPPELERWNATRDPRVLLPAISRGVSSAKVTESAEVVIGGERFSGAREVFLGASGSRLQAGAKNDFAWYRDASTSRLAIGADAGVFAGHLEAKVSSPGVKMVGVSTLELQQLGVALRQSEAHRARANVGH